MTATTHARLPAHLLRYVVEQNYARYSSEDQAVWRYIMRQLKDYLSRHAHSSYLGGLEQTGITIDRIPEIENIDRKLNEVGWGAVPVSGFIPPAAFMEFQSIGILPIASDMRTLEHLLYTPAPDIVHEAAGHAPFLADPEYSAYLRQYGEVARHAIITKADMDQYEAIRVLSDIKEDPRSTNDDIARAELRLQEVNKNLNEISEAALLSRMNWWTAEYGLVGDLSRPQIFGAGLLSSVGESKDCLSEQVKKIPLSVNCVDYSYDITEQQPQLFVARDFTQLTEVLEDLAQQLSYRRGGIFGLQRAASAKTVNSVQLNSGIQISGLFKKFISSENQPAYLSFEGPCQLAVNYKELSNQGTKRHAHGFSSPVGKVMGQIRCLSEFNQADLSELGLIKGQRAKLEFESGVMVDGLIKDFIFHDSKLVVITWSDAKAWLKDQILFEPEWGDYDMAVGSEVISVFGGPADRDAYGPTEDFVAKKIPVRKPSPTEQSRYAFFQEIRDLREKRQAEQNLWRQLSAKFLSESNWPWLTGLELIELGYSYKVDQSEIKPLIDRLEVLSSGNPATRRCVSDGLRLAQNPI